ncbi:hypothetical protein TWF281_007866 [Arthrobotrys megalospora]
MAHPIPPTFILAANPNPAPITTEDVKSWTNTEKVLFSVGYPTYHSIWLALLFKQDLSLDDVVTMSHKIASQRYRGTDARLQHIKECFAKMFDLNWAKKLCAAYRVSIEDPQRLKLVSPRDSSDSAPKGNYDFLVRSFLEKAFDDQKFRCNYYRDFLAKTGLRPEEPRNHSTNFLKKFSIQRITSNKRGFCIKNVLYFASMNLNLWAEDIISFEYDT